MKESWGTAPMAIEAAAIELTLRVALANRTLLAEYDRLAGTNLCQRGSPLENAIDDATGRADGDLRGFLAFAKDALWDRADHATRDALRAQVAARADGATPEAAP